MAITVTIPTALRRFADNQASVEVQGKTITEVLDSLTQQHAQLRQHLFTEDGKLRNFVRVYVNDEDIRARGDDAPVSDGDEISIVPSIAGGSSGRSDLPVAKGQEVAAGGPLLQPIIKERAKLTNEEIKRYSRHLILPEVGVEGQERIKAAKVLLIGSGGLGSPLALYLTAAGVGRIGMVEFDTVDFSNLQRQIIHFTSDVGKHKLKSAEEKLKAINPNLNFIPHPVKLTSDNALDILKDYDVVIDGTDNFPTRYLVNDACVMLKKPNVYGSIFRFEGMASVFAPHLGGPCYRCWYPEPPPPGLVPSCAEGGVLGVICGIIGNIQANEAIKLIIGKGKPLMGRLLRFDAMDMSFREYKIPRDPNCPVCGKNPTVTKLIDYDQFCGLGRGEGAASTAETVEQHAQAADSDDIEVEEVKAMLDRGEDFVFVDVRNPDEFEICTIPGTVKLPLPELPQRFQELPKDKLIILHCHHGPRSKRAMQFLRSQGYPRVKNVPGGIDAWSERIEPDMPRY
jgi:molybdopterin/thiamine biosynthesis adenylyltransferase/rhodanese-related sulfurtransferase/molybdopterin converting factor small subunit